MSVVILDSFVIRVDAELCRNGKLEAEIKRMTSVIASLEQQIAELKIKARERPAEAANPELLKLRVDYENLKKEWA